MVDFIHTWGVNDPLILDLITKLPRESFIASGYRTVAYSDTFLPIGYNQVTLPPKIIARLLQALKLSQQERVLEVGTGSGYLTTLLSHLSKTVISIEIIPELARIAQENLTTHHVTTAQVEIGNGRLGWLKQAPYDVIVLTGAIPRLEKNLVEQLTIGGRLFAVIGKPPVMFATLITRTSKLDWQKEELFETEFPFLSSTQTEYFDF